MIRIILSALAGYAAMAFSLFLLFTGAYLAMGTERAFKPESFETSVLWCVLSLVLSLPAAAVGGWICANIGQGFKGLKLLVGLIAVVGIAAAVMTTVAKPPEGKRAGDVRNLDAMSKAVTPPWVAWLNPLIGVTGVLIGARLAGNRQEPLGEPVVASAQSLRS